MARQPNSLFRGGVQRVTIGQVKAFPTWRDALARIGPAEAPKVAPIERIDASTLAARIGAAPRQQRPAVADLNVASAPWRRALRTPPSS